MNGGRKRNERGREEDRSSGHKLNITDGFTNWSDLNSSVIISIKITCHYTFLLFNISVGITVCICQFSGSVVFYGA